MTRRRFLGVLGGVGLALLPGCASGDTPESRFRGALASAGVGIRALSAARGGWELEYLTTATTTDGLRAEARTIALAYADHHPEGDHTLGAVAIADAEDALAAEWRVEAAWTTDGETAYFDRVRETTDAF
ncbi:hypothetical protein DM867_01735 [Halosegnis rubeus]|jgi:hypothetical protein|uniref:DUF8159 domain-containing protein n=1 Tax=Halosegnis rubeus TaxID=2212850 RepID=A0A5N5UE40_9EURY|nr:hypothetical protein [Halosegnis rubeus]KAB7515888.1 hypothetical protein DM867_01735 [Halosegnis rubeus]KAB7516897.1 hypothetical protein DMP03_05910 [Halosegnis rubeus]KAB7519974.1 hypothetical protein DP108_01620 [Halosegnis rubeus]